MGVSLGLALDRGDEGSAPLGGAPPARSFFLAALIPIAADRSACSGGLPASPYRCASQRQASVKGRGARRSLVPLGGGCQDLGHVVVVVASGDKGGGELCILIEGLAPGGGVVCGHRRLATCNSECDRCTRCAPESVAAALFSKVRRRAVDRQGSVSVVGHPRGTYWR